MTPAAAEGAPVSEWLLTYEGRAWLDDRLGDWNGGCREGPWARLKADTGCPAHVWLAGDLIPRA